MESRDMLDALMKPFPPHAIKQRQGGGNQLLSYVETETVIRRLNATVGTWDFRITEIKVIDQLVVIWGELTIPGLGTRAGTGVQVLRGGEDMWKGAASDCLKKCATLFGVGIELYGPDLEAGEIDNPSPAMPPRSRSTTTNTVPSSADVPVNLDDAWTMFWAEARRAGLTYPELVEQAIGPYAGDPVGALQRLRAKVGGQPSAMTPSAPATPPQAATGQPATPRQIKFIEAVAREAGIGHEQVQAEVMQLYGCSLPNLDRRDASAFIERLQTRRNIPELAS